MSKNSKKNKLCLTKEKGNYVIKEDADPKRVKEMLEDIKKWKIKEDLSDFAYITLVYIELEAIDFLNTKESEN